MRQVTLLVVAVLARCYVADVKTAVPLTFIFIGALAVSTLFARLYAE